MILRVLNYSLISFFSKFKILSSFVVHGAVPLHHLNASLKKNFHFCMNIFKKLPLTRSVLNYSFSNPNNDYHVFVSSWNAALNHERVQNPSISSLLRSHHVSLLFGFISDVIIRDNVIEELNSVP